MIERARSSIYCFIFHTILKTMWRVSKYLFIILTFKNKHMIRIRSQASWQRNSIWKFGPFSRWKIHSAQGTYLLALIYLKISFWYRFTLPFDLTSIHAPTFSIKSNLKCLQFYYYFTLKSLLSNDYFNNLKTEGMYELIQNITFDQLHCDSLFYFLSNINIWEIPCWWC